MYLNPLSHFTVENANTFKDYADTILLLINSQDVGSKYCKPLEHKTLKLDKFTERKLVDSWSEVWLLLFLKRSQLSETSKYNESVRRSSYLS